MLTIRRSSGFTLVELLVGLVLLGIVSTTLYRVLTSQQRLARAQTEQVSLQSAVRIGSLLVGGELKEIGISNAGISDISAMSSNSITYRAMRSTALACQVSATEVRIRQTPLFGTRAIAAQQDTMLLFVEGDPDLGSDDQWIVLPITAVTNSTCGGTQAFALATTINTAVTPLANIVLDAPVSGGKTGAATRNLRNHAAWHHRGRWSELAGGAVGERSGRPSDAAGAGSHYRYRSRVQLL